MTRLALLALLAALWAVLGCSGRPLSGRDSAAAGLDAGGGLGGAAGAASGGDGGVGGVSAGGGAGVVSGVGGAAGLGGGGPAIDAGGLEAAPVSDAAAGEPAVQIPRVACNVGCPDGPCAVRAGTPMVIAAGPPGEHVGAIAVGADAVYYGTIVRDVLTRGELRRVSLAGGPSMPLKSGVQVARILIDADGTIYFVADEVQSSAMRLWSLVGAGPAVVNDVNDYAMDALPTHGGEVYVEKAESQGGFIAWHDNAGYYSFEAQLMGTPHGLALDDVNLYWADGDGPGRISKRARNDGSSLTESGSVMTTADDVLASPIAAGTDLYFIHQHAPGDCEGSVMVMPTAGGGPSLVSLGHSGSDVSSLAVDDAFVYWTTPDAGGLVFRAARGGGTPEVIASEQAGARAVAVAPGTTRIYWIAVGASGDEVRAVDLLAAGAL
jgi:hypothetical protein